MSSKDKALRGEVIGSLENRIKTEKSMLYHRLSPEDLTEAQRPVASAGWRTTGRLYKVFQALSTGEHD